MLSRTTSRQSRTLSFKRSRALSGFALEDSRPNLEQHSDSLLQYDDDFPIVTDNSTSNRTYHAISDTEISDVESGNNVTALSSEEQKAVISPFKVRVIALCLFSNVFLASLDSTMVATLLTVMASDLNQMSNISWVVTSYLLSCAAFQPLFGKLSDVFGRRAIVSICTFLFSLGCLICGVSKDFWFLVFGRFLAGIGGGGFGVMSSITLSDLIPPNQRGVYQGYISLCYQSGAASGGLVAGFFQHYLGWRMAFLVQVPLSMFTGLMIQIFFKVPAGAPGSGLQGHTVWKRLKALDWIGTFFLVSSIFALLLAASLGGKEVPFNSFMFKGLVGIAIAGLIVFYFYELGFANEPILPMTLLRNKTILYTSLGGFFLEVTATSCFFYLPFYWTSVKNLSPLEAGERLIPSTFTTAMSSLSAGYAVKRTLRTKTPLYWSSIFLILGAFYIYFSSVEDPPFRDYIVRIPQTIGSSSNFNFLLVSLVAAVDNKDQAVATSIQYAFRSTGSTLGASLSSAVLEYGLRFYLNRNFNSLEHIPEEYKDKLKIIKIKALEDPKFAFDNAPEFFKSTIINSYDSACHAVFGFIIINAFITVAFGWVTPDHYLG